MRNVKSVDRELSPEKREAILQGAMQEFLEHGYAGARIDKIVAAAGVSKATLYRHFADKEALFNALIQRLAIKANLFQQHDCLPLQEEPDVFLKRYALAMLDSAAQNSQELALFRIILAESGRFPELGRAFVQAVEKPNFDFLTQYFTAHPKLQFAYPEVAARTLVGTLLHFMTIRYLLHGEALLPIDPDRLVDGLIDLLLQNNKRHG